MQAQSETNGADTRRTWSEWVGEKVESAKNLVKGTSERVQEKVVETTGSVRKDVGDAIGTVRRDVGEACVSVRKDVGEAIGTVKKDVGDACDNARDTLRRDATAQKISDWLRSLSWKSVSDGVDDSLKTASERVDAALKNASDRLEEARRDASDRLEEARTRVGEQSVRARETTASALAEAKLRGANLTKRRESRLDEKAAALALWSAGAGSMREEELPAASVWGESPQEILHIEEAAGAAWATQNGCESGDVTITAWSEVTRSIEVRAGEVLRWRFRARDFDVGFALRLSTVTDDGESRADDILPTTRLASGRVVEGSWTSDADRTVSLVFDNKYSLLRSKRVAFVVGRE